MCVRARVCASACVAGYPGPAMEKRNHRGQASEDHAVSWARAYRALRSVTGGEAQSRG